MPGPAHGAPPPTLRGRGFPTRSGQTRARARSHSGGGGGSPPHPRERRSHSFPQARSSLRKVDLLRELRQFICDHQGFYLLLTLFFLI